MFSQFVQDATGSTRVRFGAVTAMLLSCLDRQTLWAQHLAARMPVLLLPRTHCMRLDKRRLREDSVPLDGVNGTFHG